MKKKFLAVVLASCLGLAACGAGRPPRVEVLTANPMANPTLSFTEPSDQRSFGGTGAGLVGAADAAIHTTVFEIDASQTRQGLNEILEQAEAAGFQLELVSSDERLPSGTHVGQSSVDGVEMEIVSNHQKIIVSLR